MNWYIQAQSIGKNDPELKSMLEAYNAAQGPDKETMKQAIIARIQSAPNGQAPLPNTPKAATPVPAEDANWAETPALEIVAQVTTIDSKEIEALHEISMTLPMPAHGICIPYIRSALRNRFLRPYFLKNKIPGIKAIQTILTDESLIHETSTKFRFENLPMEQWDQNDFQLYAFKSGLTSFPKPNTMSLSALRAWAQTHKTNVTTTMKNESDPQ